MSNKISINNLQYARVILPLALPKVYTYLIPEEYKDQVFQGIRVEVPLRNKIYSGIVLSTHTSDPGYKVRPIISPIDDTPVVGENQLIFWKWISDYYCCTLGEVMGVALPSGLKLYSETRISRNPFTDEPSFHQLSDKEFVIYEALANRKYLTIQEIQKMLDQKTVYPIIKEMMKKKLIRLDEELEDKYKEKTRVFIRLTDYYREDRNRLSEALDLTRNSEKQTNAILSYVQESGELEEVPKSLIYKKADANHSVIQALEKKGVFEIVTRPVDRIQITNRQGKQKALPLTGLQKEKLDEINQLFEEQRTILLHGVTGSGKTRIYLEKIKEALSAGGQALYLVPEIALTTQMVQRIHKELEFELGFYHSRMNIHERVELWNKVIAGLPVTIGARSSLFLPFKDLKIIIVDEEHDHSYKQQDPSPRYNARDAAIYLAGLYDAKVLLGTATPSLETLHNAQKEKYGYVSIADRYGGASLPEVEIIDMREERQAKAVKYHMSQKLLDEIAQRIEKREQVILFQNRRGYAPTLKCHKCGWHSECPNCDVSLTIHDYAKELRCHYCSYRTPIRQSCPACGNLQLSRMGFGTEKVEIALAEIFSGAKIARMDYDAVRTKKSYEKVIHQMESGYIDILVGTQMITKGLDFDQVTLVGILNADALLMFPDFRATEKAFHLLTQVSGRAGRREKVGKVLIQTSNPEHPVIQEVTEGDFNRFSIRELSERNQFFYPPYSRIIRVDIKHKKQKKVQEASLEMAEYLKQHLGRRVLGPSIPYISKIRNMYIYQIMLKLEKSPVVLKRAKEHLQVASEKVLSVEGLKTTRINIDVDPL